MLAILPLLPSLILCSYFMTGLTRKGKLVVNGDKYIRELKFKDTQIILQEGQLAIANLGDGQLFHQREGRYEQVLDSFVKVEDGDKFVLLSGGNAVDTNPPKRKNKSIYENVNDAEMITLDEDEDSIDLDSLIDPVKGYTFRVVLGERNVRLEERNMSVKQRIVRGVALMVVLLFILGLTVSFFAAMLNQNLCTAPEYKAFYNVKLSHNASDQHALFLVEVPKVCPKSPFFAEDYIERIKTCASLKYPNLDPNGWLMMESSGPQYQRESGNNPLVCHQSQ